MSGLILVIYMTFVSFFVNLLFPNYLKMNCNLCFSYILCRLKFLTPEELDAVNNHKQSIQFKAGSVVFDEGQPLKGIYCIQQGVIKLSKLSPNGKDQIIKLAIAGEFLGRRSVFTKERSTLKAVALNDVSVCFIPKKTFLSIVAHNADFSFSLLTRFAEDLIDADNSIVSLGQKSVSERMATILLYLRKYIGINADGSLAVQLSRSDYANIIGAATESVIRVLADFKQDGLISMHNKRIIINNTGALRARSSSVNQ